MHFISYFLDIPSFFRKVQKPIVWTLHDMSPFLGCFHYRMDSENNAAAFGLLEKELIEIKRTAYNEHQTLKIVTPSKWLMRESMASTALRNKEHYHIRYSLDTDLFKPGDTKLIRHQYGLPDNKTLFLFVSEQLGNKRKGFDLLLQAINNLSPDKFHLASIGRPSGELQRLTNYTALGTIEDTKEMAKLYAAADAFVLPSREDNLPNTMLEALSCGTPVVAFRTGGMADEIEPGFNGYLADEMNPNCLSVALQKFLDNPLAFDNAAIRCRAVKLYSMIRQAEEYKRLYASFEI